MKKLIFLLPVFGFLVFAFSFFSFSQKVIFINEKSFLVNDDFSLLLLGKPGPGYIGSENTDSIVVVYYRNKNNTLYLIPIPRDLIVYNEKGELEKINALYEERKIDILLEKAEEYTGIPVRNYIVVDLELVKKIVDKLGGIEVYLDEPVTDAVTLYSLPPGKHHLDGYFVELVIRSRYHPTGDFFRIRNQMKVLKALKEKIVNLSNKEKLELIEFLEKNKYHWQTNLDKKELLKIALTVKDLENLKIEPIIVDFSSGLLASSYFNTKQGRNVYGLYPRAGIDKYETIQIYIKSRFQR